MSLPFFAIFGIFFLCLYLGARPQRDSKEAPLKTTPLAFSVQLGIILFLLFSRIYRPEAPPRDRWEAFDHLLGMVVIVGCSANLVWMYFRLFYRYEQLAALTKKGSDRLDPEARANAS